MSLVFCFLSVCAHAQAKAVAFNQQVFTVEDGLPQSFVSGILQDQLGFIWVSTSDGLARYDGRSFKIFYKDPNSFPSNVIYRMVRTGQDLITLVFESGEVTTLDPISIKFNNIIKRNQLKELIDPFFANTLYKNNFTNFFYRDPKNKGIHWVDVATGILYYAGTSNGKLKSDSICGVVQDPAGTLYILTLAGIEISKDFGRTFQLMPLHIPAEVAGGYFRDILFLPGGSLVKMYDNKLFFIDIKNRKTNIITIPRGKQLFKVANQLNVDKQGRLYVELDGRIFRLEQNGELKLLWENNINPDFRITACYIDDNDVLWVSVDAQGLAKINLRTAPFKSFTYQHGFFTDVYEHAGLPKTKLPESWFVDQGASYHYYHDYAPDSNLYLFHSTIEKDKTDIVYWKNNQLKPLPFPRQSLTLSRGIVAGKDGSIWAADMSKGLWHWKNKESFPRLFPFDSSGVYNIINTQIADILLQENQLWVSTHGKGLFLFENGIMQKEFKQLYNPEVLPGNLTDIIADPFNKNLLWIGTRGEGLILFDKKQGLKKIFTTRDGLPNNTIYCIAADAKGMLWLSTNKGICRFNPKNFSSTSFTKSDGLAGNEFNRYHKFVFLDGRIAFGGLEGYSIFNPADFDEKQQIDPVSIQITRIFINNEEQEFTQTSGLINKPFSKLDVLELPYNKNYLSVEFAALQFNEPEKLRYLYMLQGADKTWRETGVNNLASYTQLRPGSYTLLMNATSFNGGWSNTILKLPVIIKPPFWATWWAYVLYVLIALAALRFYFIYHKRRLKEQQQLIFEQKEAERLKELDEVKDRFFSNVTHEFRTPLTLILSPLEKLQLDEALPEKSKTTIQGIYRNTKQLLKLINEFLDFSKLNQGQMKLHLSHGEFNVLVEQIVEQFEPQAKEKGLHLSYTSSGVNGLFYFDKEKWEKILFNLLSNALKFTDNGGTVHVSLTKSQNEKVSIKVADTGIGIPSDQLPNIFDRFYQVDSSATRHYGGTGIGLSLVKELVVLMGGSIETESLPGRGTTFIIHVPLKVSRQHAASENFLKGVPILIDSKKALSDISSEKPLILVVEDNIELQSFLLDNLGDESAIIAASDGMEAWDIILNEMPEVIISDVMMPGRDGFELCRMCKSDPRTNHIGFILLTSRAAHETKLQGLEMGADDYITKPFHLDELNLRVNNLLQLQQKQRTYLQSQVLPQKPVEALPAVNDVFVEKLYKLLDDNL
ncbi:MAG: response regulator, partial [Flavisolibacter sp.]|nr:response regulator [Flavisolibacter sp.]